MCNIVGHQLTNIVFFSREKSEPTENDAEASEVDTESTGNTLKQNETDQSQEENNDSINTDDGDKPLMAVHKESPDSEKGEKTWTLELFEEQWRKFNIDLMPKVII